MRKSLQNFDENYGNTTRLVFFQLAAITADYLLLWPRQNTSTVKKAVNTAYAAGFHTLAYLAAKFFEKPKAALEKKDGAQTLKQEIAVSSATTPISSHNTSTADLDRELHSPRL